MNGRTAATVGALGTTARRRRAESGGPEADAHLVDFRTLVEWMPAVTFVDSLDEPVTTLYVSPQIEALVGVSPEEYVAEPGLWNTFLHPEDRERAQEESVRVARAAIPSPSSTGSCAATARSYGSGMRR